MTVVYWRHYDDTGLQMTVMSCSSQCVSSITVATSACSVYAHAIRLHNGQPICSHTCGASSRSDSHMRAYDVLCKRTLSLPSLSETVTLSASSRPVSYTS